MALLAGLATIAPRAEAAPGDKAGWQFSFEGEGDGERQFLYYVDHDNGPRELTFACKSDIDTFGFYAEDLSELTGPVSKATMVLNAEIATLTIPGVIEADPDTDALGFVAEIPKANAGARFEATLVPLLLAQKPIRMAFGQKVRVLPPVTGMLDPAKRFLRSCFKH